MGKTSASAVGRFYTHSFTRISAAFAELLGVIFDWKTKSRLKINETPFKQFETYLMSYFFSGFPKACTVIVSMSDFLNRMKKKSIIFQFGLFTNDFQSRVFVPYCKSPRGPPDVRFSHIGIPSCTVKKSMSLSLLDNFFKNFEVCIWDRRQNFFFTRFQIQNDILLSLPKMCKLQSALKIDLKTLRH